MQPDSKSVRNNRIKRQRFVNDHPAEMSNKLKQSLHVRCRQRGRKAKVIRRPPSGLRGTPRQIWKLSKNTPGIKLWSPSKHLGQSQHRYTPVIHYGDRRHSLRDLLHLTSVPSAFCAQKKNLTTIFCALHSCQNPYHPGPLLKRDVSEDMVGFRAGTSPALLIRRYP